MKLVTKTVIPEHLCKYLENRHSSHDMYEGHAMKNNKDVFNSGAAGYILSRETMRKLVHAWDEDNEICLVKNGDKWLQGNPGIVTTKCLKEVMGISAVDTRHHGKWHRFHAFPLTRMVTGQVDEWYKNKHVVRMMTFIDCVTINDMAGNQSSSCILV